MTTSIQESLRREVIFSYLRMTLFGIGVTLIAILTAQIVNEHYPFSQAVIRLFEYSGYICWCATLGMMSWEIQTWGCDTPADRLNQGLSKIFSIIGVFVFVFARELVPLA